MFPQDFNLTKTCSHGKALQTTRGISTVYLDSPTTKIGEFLKRGAVLPNATKRVKYLGQKVRTNLT